jgi:hypothetical protein
VPRSLLTHLGAVHQLLPDLFGLMV